MDSDEVVLGQGLGDVLDAGLSDAEEQKLIRRLNMMMSMVMQVITQDASLRIDDASQMIADARNAALAMFPGKELAYDLIWKPRLQRLMRERFRIM
jgi:pyridoxal/pyridoxine/pyridoxamine kinase